MAASVIGVCVTVQNDFDVLYLESKFCHALANSGHGRFKAGMEQDVTLSRGDEKRTDAGSPDGARRCQQDQSQRVEGRRRLEIFCGVGLRTCCGCSGGL